MTWCRQKDVRLNAVEILAKTPDHRGLYATKEIQPGTALLTIPRCAALIADTSASDPPALKHLPVTPSFWQDCEWPTRLALCLLNEMLAPSSNFEPYISILPPQPNTALWAYETSGRNLLSRQLSRYRLSGMLNALRARVKSQFASLRAALPSDVRHRVSLKMFSWAISIAQSRAFGIPPPFSSDGSHNPTRRKEVTEPTLYALFPALDMVNHSVHCPTKFAYDESQDAYIVSTGASFRRGDEVFLSYGPKSNDSLLFFYGFVEGNNPANSATISDLREWVLGLAHEDGRDADWDQKLALLVKHGLTDPHELFYFRLDGVSDKLMLVLRVALASHEEFEAFQSELMENPKRLYKPLSLENELSTWASISAKCEQLLDELGDFSLEEQEELTMIFGKHPCSVAWQWGQPASRGELLYRYERQNVLGATMERVKHFAHISSSVGRICTVLVPPSQSLLKTDLFSGMGNSETAGVHRFSISPEDLQIP